MSSPRRNRYHHGDLPHALIEATLELMAQDGSETLTLRRVAERVGVSHAAPYRHFKDKSALLAAVAKRGFHSLNEVLDRNLHPDAPADEQLAALTRCYLGFAVKQHAYYRLMFDHSLGDDADGSLRAANTALVEKILIHLRAIAEAEGRPAASVERTTALIGWAQLHGLASLQLSGHLTPDDASASANVDVIAAALSCRNDPHCTASNRISSVQPIRSTG